MALDSKAAFQGRLNEVGLTSVAARFAELGWSTHAGFAFATSYTPGGDEATFVDEIFVRLTVNVAPDDRDMLKPPIRRLFFESYTLAATDLKRRIESSNDDAPRKVPNLEREERREKLAARLIGVDMDSEELNCSNALIDLAIAIYDADCLTYVGPEKCTKKDLELRGVNRDPVFVPDAAGVMRMKSVREDPCAPLESQFALQFAFRRRALAFEMGDLLKFELHELLIAKLVSSIMRDPLPGYARVSVEQALRADVVAFRVMARLTRRGVKRDAHNARPLDAALPLALKDDEFLQALAPLQSKSGGGGSGDNGKRRTEGEASERPAKRSRAERRRESISKAANELASRSAQKGGGAKGAGSGKAGSKGGGKAAGSEARLPRELIGKAASTTQDGKRLCFSFNLRGCPDAAAGGQCAKGMHLCMKLSPGNTWACGGSHTFPNCPH